jgi:hypothetical protein
VNPEIKTSARLKVPAFVAGVACRDSLIEPFLHGQDYYVNRDPGTLEIPKDFKWDKRTPPGLINIPRKGSGHYRCWENHRIIARAFLDWPGQPEVGLFFEDDAVPNCDDWIDIVNRCIPMAEHFKMFNLYGRSIEGEYDKQESHIAGRQVWVPTKPGYKVLGSLAYLQTRATAQVIADTPFTGIPVDVAFPRITTFGMLQPDVFDHDRRQGSLLDGHKGEPGFKPKKPMGPPTPVK